MTEKQWRAWLKIKAQAFAFRATNTKGDEKYYRSAKFLLKDLEAILKEAKTRVPKV